jgi:hypothetical protein
MGHHQANPSYSGDVSFRTQAEAIDQITRAMLDYYAKHSGLKVAV